MRITIVQGAFMPVPAIFGSSVEKIWHALGQEFARQGHTVTHISRRHPSLKQEEVVEGVHHIRIPGYDSPRSLVRLKWRDLLYSRRVLGVLPPADILVTNTFWLPVIAPPAKAGKIYVHIARYPKGQMKFYKKAARLQTVSTVIRNAVCREVPRLAPRVKMIPNFVLPREDASPFEERGKSILYVGRIHPEKGVHLLIEAFSKLVAAGASDWKLRLVGPWQFEYGGGGEEYFQRLRGKTSAIEKYIEWVGPVFDHQQLSGYYRESSFLVYPSVAGRGEASPLAPLEAMAEGCPPVVSSLECFRDYIQPEANGWTFDERAEHAPSALAATLQKIVSDGNLLRAARAGALKTAKRLALPNVANLYLNDFQEIALQ
jgi:glycosyltransferase involved in cell wall biosynthesis